MTVHFIGAGPGAADLITVRGRDLIERCPVCLYAGSIVSPELLQYCPPDARIVDTAPMSLDEIEAEYVRAAEAGEDVARLHSGDLSVWSAVAEQIRRLEADVTAAGGVALRYGGFYGPGTGMVPGGEQWELVMKRRFPLVGDGGGIWSFAQIEDAAAATVAALERWTPGEVYNVCDDDPAPLREWLPYLAHVIGAPPPRHVPRWVGRLLGAHVVALTCEVRGASNAKARRELHWTPRWRSWREGFSALTNGDAEAAAGGVSRRGASAAPGASAPRGA